MGTTESLLYDDRPPDESDRQRHPAAVSRSSEQRLQTTTPGPQPKKPTRPITRLSGVVVGGLKVGKRTLLQRLQGTDPFALDANNTDVLSSVNIAYKPPAGMPTWNRIQLQLEKGAPHAFPKVDFVVILLRLSHNDDQQEIQNLMLHALGVYLKNLGYTRDEESNACCAPVCICVLYNFRDLKNEQEMTTPGNAVEDTLETFVKTILKQYSIPSDRLILEFLSTSLRNGYGLDHLHHFIYRTYLQKKREALEAQLRAVTVQISQTIPTDIVPYHEFVKQLSPPDRNVSPYNKGEHRQPKRVVINDKKASLPSSLRDEDTRSRSNRQQQPTPSSVTASKTVPVDPEPLPTKSSNDRARRNERRQIYPEAKQPIRLDTHALEAFLGGESSDEDRVPRKRRKEKSSKKKLAARVIESSDDDDDDDFFYDEKGQFMNRKAKGYKGDDSSSASSSSSSSSSSQSRQNIPPATASKNQRAKRLATKPDQGGPHPANEAGDPTRRPANVEPSNTERVTDEIPPKKIPDVKINKPLPETLMHDDQTTTAERHPSAVTPGTKASHKDDESEDNEFFVQDSRASPNTNKIEPEDETHKEHVQSHRTTRVDNHQDDDSESTDVASSERLQSYTNLDEKVQEEEPDIPATPRALETTHPSNIDDSNDESKSNCVAKPHDSQKEHDAATEQHAETSIYDEHVDEAQINDNGNSHTRGEDTEMPSAVVAPDTKMSSDDECDTDKRIDSSRQHSTDDSDDDEFFIGDEKSKDDSSVVDAIPASGSHTHGDNNIDDDADITSNVTGNPRQHDNNDEPNHVASTDYKTRAIPLVTQKSTSSPRTDGDSDNDEYVVGDETRMIESTTSSRPSSSLDITGTCSSRDTTISAPSSGISSAALAAIQAAQREAEAMLLQSIESDNDNQKKPKKAKKEKKQKKDGGEKKKKKKKDKSSRKERLEEAEASD